MKTSGGNTIDPMTRCLYISAIIVALVLIVALIAGLVSYFIIIKSNSSDSKNYTTNDSINQSQWTIKIYNASLYFNNCKTT